MPSDAELLLAYAHERSEAAFAELVRTHVDLVYSAALRRVGGDSHAAAEVTQEVFVAMARHAARLASHPVLNAWLHASTRNAAANRQRRDRRRERLNLEIQAMDATQSPAITIAAWQAIREVLDDALDGLKEKDRQAIILRFFEGQSYPQMGSLLGLPEETARRRVDRALEKLRVRLQHHGISSTAAVLGGTLSTHAVIAAPAGLVTSIIPAASLAAAMATGSTLGLLQIMTTTKLYATLAGVAAIAAVFLVSHERTAMRKAEAAAATANAQVQALTRERDRLAQQVSALAQVDNGQRVSVVLPTLGSGDEKVAALKDMFARLPDQSIPELPLATDGDWHSAVDGSLETQEDYRRAMAKVRSAAENRFAKLVHPAVRAYLTANGGKFPTDPLQLAPFVAPEIERAMLQRYRVVPAGEVKNVRMGGETMMTQVALIDSEYDSLSVIGPQGVGSTTMKPTHLRDLQLLKPAMNAYKAAHDGKSGEDIQELIPFATTPEQHAAIQRLAQKAKSGP